MPPVFGPTTWALILNPVSGRGAGLRDRARIEAALREQGLEFHSVVSRHAGHTIGLAAEAVSLGCRRIVVAGGDGSLGEAANGILGQDAVPPDAVHLGLIPLGTGNDWARMRSMPADYAAAARVLARGWTACQDVGVIEFPDGMRRHFVNVAGTGFDAAVLENMPSRRFGRLAYVVGLLRALASHRPVALRWRSEAGEGGADAFVLFACIGRYCGGGMHVAPMASDADGRIDLVLIRHMSRLRVLASLPQLFDGSILRHPRVTHWQTQVAELPGPVGISIQADGELVGRLPARIRVRPGLLRVVVGSPR
jgi:YegS/Rv2252/BmrU family lipid kinase